MSNMGFKVTQAGAGPVSAMVGFLYAIAHGAKLIYSSDGYTGPSALLLSRSLSKTVSSLRFHSEKFFNPYRHFGQPHLYTPHHIYEGQPPKKRENRYSTFEWKTPLIMKEMFTGRNKVEFRVNDTSVMRGDLYVSFDQHAPMATVSEKSFASLDQTNSMYLYDSFFALFKPLLTTDEGSVTWEYWSQRLLWELNGEGVGFLVANNNTGRYRDSNTPYTPLKYHTINSRISSLNDLVTSWKCSPEEVSLSICIKVLTQLFVDHGFWPQQNAALVDAWISDLKSVGYKQPWRIPSEQYERQLSIRDVRPTYFWPSLQCPSDDRIPRYQGYDVGNRKICQRIRSVCKTNIKPTKLKNLPYEGKKIQDILLIVVFNSPFYQNIEFIEHLYARHFAHVLYCGETYEIFNKFNKYFKKPTSYIESNHYRGFLGYDCMVQAMRMNYNVKGYLHMGDDVLLNVWNINDLPRDKIWFQLSMRLAKRSSAHVPDLHKAPEWGPWTDLPGKRALVFLWETLEKLSVDDDVGPQVLQFLNTLAENTGSREAVVYEASDIFYVPSIFAEQYMYFARLFVKHGVFLEIAVPTILNGIENNNDIFRLEGYYLWYSERDYYASKFKEEHHFFHAWKLSSELGKNRGVKFFCKVVLAFIDRDLIS